MLTGRWRKASYSTYNGNCVEARWRKSSYSMGNGDCTEVAAGDGVVLVRDSRQAPRRGFEGPSGPVLAFTPAAWRAFLASVKDA